MISVEKHTEQKDCRCGKCKKLLFYVQVDNLRVNIQLDPIKTRILSIKCDRCKEINNINL